MLFLRLYLQDWFKVLFAAFVDVSPEETVQKSTFEDVAELSSSNNAQFPKDVSFWLNSCYEALVVRINFFKIQSIYSEELIFWILYEGFW